jgi:hypothetical protein
MQRYRYWLPGLVAAIFFYLFGFSQHAMAACTYGACAPSNIIVSTQVSQFAAQQTATVIADRIGQAIADIGNIGAGGFSTGGPTRASTNGAGEAAGGLPKNWGMWADASNLWLNDTQPGANFTGHITTGLVGVDYLLNDRILVGFAAGYEGIHLDTGFNAGTLRSNGFTTALYGGYVLSPYQNIDFEFGHTGIDYNEMHEAAGSLAGAGSFGASRWFSSGDFNNKQVIGNWQFTESLGYLYLNEVQDQFVETNGSPVASSTIYLGELRAKGIVGYLIPMPWGSVTPYGLARLEYDPIRSAAPVINSLGQTVDNGRFGTTFNLGVSARSGDLITTSIEASTTQFRQYFQSYGVKGSLRVNF